MLGFSMNRRRHEEARHDRSARKNRRHHRRLRKSGTRDRTRARGARIALIGRHAPADAHLSTGIDLNDENAARQAIDEIATKLGGLHALVNVAGAFRWETIGEGSAQTWQSMFDLNVMTALNASKAALAHLNESGRIVNVGALAAMKAGAGMGAYAASKAALVRSDRSARRQSERPRRDGQRRVAVDHRYRAETAEKRLRTGRFLEHARCASGIRHLHVAVVIVVGLEEIDIDHHERQRRAGRFRRLPFARHHGIEHASIADAHQTVAQ